MSFKIVLKVLRGAGIMLWLAVLSINLSTAQTPDSTIQPTPPTITVQVQPENYKRTCYPVHTLLFDSNYQAYLNAPNLRLDEHYALNTDYSDDYDNAGWQYVPQTVATFGLTAAYAWCESGDPVALQLAVSQADWLVANAEKREDFITWVYNFPNPSFFSPAGWTSGLGNGQAIVLLTQLYELSGDARYLESARQAVGSYQVDMRDGGVRTTWDDGSVVFEEVARPEIPVSFILNGHMVAVDSLAFYAGITGDQTAAQLVDDGIQAVRSHLADFDASTITSYSLGPVPWGSSRFHYAHGIHVRGLFWMYTRTNDPAFLQYAFDWQRYKWPPIPSDAYRNVASPDRFMEAIPDHKRILYEPADTEAFILDLRESQPVRSFGYNMVGPYPDSYDISVSDDGTNWTPLLSKQSNRHHDLVMLDDVKARYVRWSLGPLVRDNPFYDQISGGIYHDFLMVGVMRADNAAYWEEPVLLVTDGTTDYDDAQYLRDHDPQTTLMLPANAVIYADLRKMQQASGFDVQSESGNPITRRVWAEVSDDGRSWRALIAQENAVERALPGRVDLPAASADYRYLRLHLDGDTPLTMTEANLILASPQPAP